ncbi:MAG: FAD-binding oxidoreductase [Bauldia litoralis]
MKDRFAIKLTGREEPVFARAGDSILDACIAAGVPMPYNCRSGECAECRARLLDGTVEETPGADPAVFTDADRDQGRILTCLCSPTSDVELDILLRDGTAAPRIERVDAVVDRIEPVSGSVSQVTLATGRPLSFRAGQYFEWGLPGIAPNRSFSAANRPGSDRIEFDIRHYPGGKVSDYVRATLRPGDTVELTGPYGHFGFTGNEHRPAICVAGGTGLAPIKAMVEDAVAAKSERTISLFYGARTHDDLYDIDRLDRWTAELPGFTYHLALSDEPADSAWTGARGLVSVLVTDTLYDGFGAEAYLCGPPPMIDAVMPLLEGLGIDPRDIYADRFSPAKS